MIFIIPDAAVISNTSFILFQGCHRKNKLKFQDFQGLSRTIFAFLQDFFLLNSRTSQDTLTNIKDFQGLFVKFDKNPGLSRTVFKFQDFPGPVATLCLLTDIKKQTCWVH